MTSTSRFVRGFWSPAKRSRALAQTAQALHNGVPVGACARIVCWMTLVALTTSCVVPIPATPEEGDGGPTKDTPILRSASPRDFPGPLQLPGTPTVTVTMEDHDVRDTLYLRVFKNYAQNISQGLGTVTVPNDPNTAPVTRTWPLQTTLWCAGSAGQNVTITIAVADEPFDDAGTGEMPFKTPINGGRWSQRDFVVACNQ